ncbi:MAG: hypothetical protein QXU69_07280 [Thermofilaceae archaeon]
MNAADALLTLIVAQLIYLSYKTGKLESQVAALKRKIEDLYTLLNSKQG